jgi:hypothetical protein
MAQEFSVCANRKCGLPAVEVVTLSAGFPSLGTRRSFMTGWCEQHRFTNPELVFAAAMLSAGGLLRPELNVQPADSFLPRVYA